jgi:hypothetical protein
MPAAPCRGAVAPAYVGWLDNRSQPVPLVKEPEGIGNEFKCRRADTLAFPINIGAAASPMFHDESWKPSLQGAAIEIRIVGDDEHYAAQQIVYGAIVDPVTGDHLIGDAGDLRDLR